MVKNGLPQDGLMGGVVMNQFVSPYISSKHTEANTIAQLFGNDMNKMFLGILKPWNMMQYFSTPLISMTELQGNVLEVPSFGAALDYWVPYKVSLPKIVEVISETGDKWGINDSIFFIVTDRNELSENDVFTPHKRNGIQFRVVMQSEYGGLPVEPISAEHWKVAVKYITNDKDDYVTPDVLPTGAPIYFLYNASDEFDTVRTTLKDNNRTGFTAMRYITGDSEIGITHSITSHGDTYNIESDQAYKPFGLGSYSLKEQQIVTQYLQTQAVKDPVTGKTTYQKINDKSMWMPTIVKRMVEQLALMKEHKLMWAKPHVRVGATGKRTRISAGYYYWAKELGNYSTYSDFSQIPNLVRYLAGMMFSNRRDVRPDERRISIRTGTGGAFELYKWFTDYFKASWSSQFLIVNDGKNPFLNGMISGKDSMNLAYKPVRFVEAFFPELGHIEVIHDAVLDFIDDEQEAQGRAGLYNYSSYMIFMEDITDPKYSNRDSENNNVEFPTPDTYHDGANVLLIKPKNYVDSTSIQVGTGSNPTLYSFFGMNSKSQVVSTQKKGFTITMDTCGELFVKDPTKLVLIEYVPENVSVRAV